MKKFWIVVGVLAAFFLLAVLAGALTGIVVLLQRETGFGRQEVAVVDIQGEIITSRAIVDALRRYEKRPSVKGIVIRIESPGGGVAASQEIYATVNEIRARGDQKVVASLGGVAASGGYYIACGAEKIVASPGTVTGSIGAVVHLLNLEELMGKVGVRLETVESGEYKDIGSFARELTPEERRLLQDVVDNIRKQFVKVVSERRGIPEGELALIADGRLFTGEQAKERGLVDEIGTLHDAVMMAAGLAGIKGEPRLLVEEKRKGLVERLLEGASDLTWKAAGQRASVKYILQ